MRKRRLQRRILPHQRIIVCIADLGFVAVVIQPVMSRNLIGEARQTVGGVYFGHESLSPSGEGLGWGVQRSPKSFNRVTIYSTTPSMFDST